MDRIMKSEGLWHILDNIFGHLDHGTLEICRKVSNLWDESLEWISLVKYLYEFVDKLAEHHRYVLYDSVENILNIISNWNKAVKKYVRKASIEDLLELKDSLEQLLDEDGTCHDCLVRRAVESEDLKFQEFFLFWTSYDMISEDNTGMKAFHWACNLGKIETVKMILEFSQENEGIDLNARDDTGWTAFHVTCIKDNTEIVKLILDYSLENNSIDLNVRDNFGRTAFYLACIDGRTETVKLILDFSKENETIDLNAKDDFNVTPFHAACDRGNTEIVKLILGNNSIDVNARDDSGSTAFHSACANGRRETVKLILDFSQEIDAIDLNARDVSGKTAFHLACEKGNTEIAKLIINFTNENGKINLNARDENEETAFHWACVRGRIETVKMILDNWKKFGINIKTQNNEGQTALDILRGKDQVLSHGIDRLKETITMLENEYSKIDGSQPVLLRKKKLFSLAFSKKFRE